MYGLDTTNVPTELEQLGAVYHRLYTELKTGYGTTEIFAIFERVYSEHFVVADGVITIQKINASVLQSPDDLDATFRKKNDKKARGYVVNVAETAHPDNQLNLITAPGCKRHCLRCFFSPYLPGYASKKRLGTALFVITFLSVRYSGPRPEPLYLLRFRTGSK